MDNQLKYKIAITLIPNIGPVLAKKVIAYVGSIEGVFSEKKRNLIKIPGIGEYLANGISNQNVLERAEQEIEFIEKYAIETFFYLDKNYPERLKQCNDAPVLLYSKGNTNFNAAKVISVVGTRTATVYGKDICTSLINRLAEKGHEILIVSGLAYGIDITAHKCALQNNLPTVAVLGHGLDMIYPAAHRSVAKEIVEHGALLTEYPNKSVCDKYNFVMRNRIVAGMSDATLVVESSEKGGALITAKIANSYNRDVLAVPGKSTDKYSKGCNYLIKRNLSHLVESAEDIEYVLGWDSISQSKEIQASLSFVPMNENENKIFQLLQKEGEMHIDSISRKTDIPVHVLAALMLNLEFSGVVKCLPGNSYKIV